MTMRITTTLSPTPHPSKEGGSRRAAFVPDNPKLPPWWFHLPPYPARGSEAAQDAWRARIRANPTPTPSTAFSEASRGLDVTVCAAALGSEGVAHWSRVNPVDFASLETTVFPILTQMAMDDLLTQLRVRGIIVSFQDLTTFCTTGQQGNTRVPSGL